MLQEKGAVILKGMYISFQWGSGDEIKGEEFEGDQV